MVPVTSLIVPILLAAVAVFVVSSLIHMVLRYHKNDFSAMPSEKGVAEALRPFEIPPGEYVIPYAASPKEMETPEYKERLEKGPVAFVTVMPNGSFSMGRSLLLWFLYSVFVGLFSAYITGHALGPGAPYLAVHRFAGCVAFVGYSLALIQNSIWYKRKWSTTLKSLFDGLVYGGMTGGVFGWLWPAA